MARPEGLARAAAGALVLAAAAARGADCDPAALELDRGETRRLVLCLAGLPAGATVAAPAGVSAPYAQPLRRCGIGDNRPGVHLVLTAADDARGGTLEVRDPASGAAACRMAVTVPDRVRLPDAAVRAAADGRLRLRVEAPPGTDLSPACATPPGSGAGDGFAFAATAGGAGRCARRVLEWHVEPLDARQAPAKVLLGPVRLADGSERPAVTYATAPAPAWTADMDEADAKWIDVGGVRTRYFEAGPRDAEAVVLVHGGQPSSMDGTAWDWQQNFGALAERFHVFALDRIGQGYTDNPADLEAYRDYYGLVVRHLRGFMEAVGVGRAHLVGHSQGSWPVTRLALDEPGRVASLAVVDGTMASPSRDGGKAIRFYIYLSTDLHPATGETLESVRRGMQLFSHTGNNLTEQRVGRLLAMTKQPKYAQSVAWFAKSGMSPAHPSFREKKKQLLAELEAGGLKVPLLVAWGRDDPEGSLESGLEFFRIAGASSPRARMHIFGDSGHLSHIEYPEEFNRVYTGFLLGRRE